jgi:hypothetical protein
MEHNWILDIKYNPDLNPSDDVFYICHECEVQGFKGRSGKIYVIHIEDYNLSCEELIIKNIIE